MKYVYLNSNTNTCRYSEVEDALAGLGVAPIRDVDLGVAQAMPHQGYNEPDTTTSAVEVLIEESPLEVLARYSTQEFAANSSYRLSGQSTPDTDPTLDPVVMGILTEEDMERLLQV